MNSKPWEVVVWQSANRGERREFDSKAEAYLYANEHPNAHTIEVYGPDGYYDAN